jgi:hypothetical protein
VILFVCKRQREPHGPDAGKRCRAGEDRAGALRRRERKAGRIVSLRKNVIPAFAGMTFSFY